MAFRDKYALTGRGRVKVALSAVAVAIASLTAMAAMALVYLVLRALLERLVGQGGFLLQGALRGELLLTLLAVFVTQLIAFGVVHSLLARESSVLRLTVAGRLRKLPIPFFEHHQTTDLVDAMIGDADRLERAWVQVLGKLAGAVLCAAVLAVGLIPLNWQMALASLWCVPVALLLLTFSNRYGSAARGRARSRRAAMEASMQGLYENARELRATNSQAEFVGRFDAQVDSWERAEGLVSLDGGVLASAAQDIMRLGVATALLFGAAFVRNGTLDFLTFFVYLLAASRVFLPFDDALSVVHEMLMARESGSRVGRVLDEPVVQGDEEFKPHGHDIEFDHVSFAFSDSAEPDRDVLHDVSFVARDGQVTALVGPSGSGKSTCARLAMREYDVRTGVLRVGGVDVATVDPEVLLRVYGTVFQDVTLFDDSVLENIRFGRPGATDDEVRRAATVANCDEFVERLPHGYATIIGENGARLSGGERQRISIARAILKDAPIVLLDEATASLDVGNETQVQAALSRLLVGKTVLVIAHRMRTVARADKIVVLSEGKVVEQGTPGELLLAGGTYARMAYLQALDAESQAMSESAAAKNAAAEEGQAVEERAESEEVVIGGSPAGSEVVEETIEEEPSVASASENVPDFLTAPIDPEVYERVEAYLLEHEGDADPDELEFDSEYPLQMPPPQVVPAPIEPAQVPSALPPTPAQEDLAAAIASQMAKVARGDAAQAAREAGPGDPTQIVYVQMLGKSKTYHYGSCSTLRKSKTAIRLGEAAAMGLKPCKRCHPPVL